MGVYIKGMEMPSTGLYFISVDNTGGRDKTIVTVERMLGNRDVRQVIGSFELVPVPPHGDLIGYDFCMENYELLHDDDGNPVYAVRMRDINNDPTIIPAKEGE